MQRVAAAGERRHGLGGGLGRGVEDDDDALLRASGRRSPSRSRRASGRARRSGSSRAPGCAWRSRAGTAARRSGSAAAPARGRARPRMSAGPGFSAGSPSSGRMKPHLSSLSVAGGRPEPKVDSCAGPVDAVEPVAGVVAVAVQRLGAQQVVAGVPERRALGERRRRQRDACSCARDRPSRCPRGSLNCERVEQRLVVVRVDVGDRLARDRRRSPPAGRCSRPPSP